MKAAGKGNTQIGCELKLSESTVRTVIKNKDSINKTLNAYGSPDPKVIKMECYLNVWINRKESEGVPLDKKQIMSMARHLYSNICKKRKVPVGSFKASTGWLYQFLGHKEIRNVTLTGESASADQIAAENIKGCHRGGRLPARANLQHGRGRSSVQEDA